MKKNIIHIITDAIKRGKWLQLQYLNRRNEESAGWFSIHDFECKSNDIFLKGTWFNPSLDDLIDPCISVSRIIEANVLEFTHYDGYQNVIKKIESNSRFVDRFQFDHFNNNILAYLADCYKYNKDPYIDKSLLLERADIHTLEKDGITPVMKEKIREIIAKTRKYNYPKDNDDTCFSELAVSVLSIDEGNRKFLVCYYTLTFNPEDNTLKIGETDPLTGEFNTELKFNQYFLDENYRHSLQKYIDCSLDDFKNMFTRNRSQAIQILTENLGPGEIINTRPDIYVLQREYFTDLKTLFEHIGDSQDKRELSVPLRTFFGDSQSNQYLQRTNPNIVIYDSRVNIDQARVVFNAVKHPLTLVQGPPGTGKTQTILNVILTAFFNDKNVLVTSNNNIAVDNITEKLAFKYRQRDFELPYLRLGNREMVKQAILKIRKLYETKFVGDPDDRKINKIKLRDKENNARILTKLKNYEDRQQLTEAIEIAQKFSRYTVDNNFSGGINESFGQSISANINHFIAEKQAELNKIEETTNEDILKLFHSVKDDDIFMQYLYFESIKLHRELRKPKYQELIEIVYHADENEAATEFNKWCKEDENVKLLTNIFKIIISTNISSNRLGTTHFKFDLLVIDEAGQSDIATALIPIARATSLLLVGDPNQLEPIIVLDSSVNEKLRHHYEISNDYNFMTHSIYSLFAAKSKIKPEIHLTYHYRCGKKIIDYSNQRYYQKQLKVLTQNAGGLELLSVKNKNSARKNEYFDEASGIVDYLIRNQIKDNTFIITPFVNQAEIINDLLKTNGLQQVRPNGKTSGIEAGTVHSSQGKEANNIIFSTAISPKTAKRTYDWLKNNRELINVATTRAKEKLIVVSDVEALEKLSDKSDDLFALVKYIQSNGNMTVLPSANTIQIGRSNGSKNEEEFFKTVGHFCSCQKNHSFKVKRNVKLTDVIKDKRFAENRQEFDCILYNYDEPKIVFEINGGEHVGNQRREQLDTLKRSILEQHNIKSITIPNSDIKHYELIRDLILKVIDGSQYQQTLFDVV